MSEKPLFIPPVTTHLHPSRCVEQVFQVQVMQPLMRRGETARFPVLYLSDANAHFGMASGIAHQLQLAEEVERFILVGVGYPAENPLAGEVLRRRDFVPARRRKLSELTVVEQVEGVLRPARAAVGEADRFLGFLHDELIPFVDETYPTLPGVRGFAGHSLGGGLGVHALLTAPDLFDRFVLASPSLTFDGDDYLLDQARETLGSGTPLSSRVFIGVGAEEEHSPIPAVAKARFVSSARRLVALLRKDLPDLEAELQVYPGETHSSVWPLALTHGLRRLFAPPGAASVAASAPVIDPA